MTIFTVIYWAGMIIEVAIRAPYQKNQKVAKTDQRVSLTERVLLVLLSVAGFVLPLIYSVTHWLDFANYNLPPLDGLARRCTPCLRRTHFRARTPGPEIQLVALA